MVKSMDTSRPRVRMAGTDRREQLLDVARAIVHENGFHAVTVEAVARNAGISRPVVYGHFEDLDRLLEQMVVRESRRALAQLRQVLPPAGAAGGRGDRPAAWAPRPRPAAGGTVRGPGFHAGGGTRPSIGRRSESTLTVDPPPAGVPVVASVRSATMPSASAGT